MLKSYFKEATYHPAPLAVFRVLFGLLMFYALIRFWANGWIETLYINPQFHFKYFGFSWVNDLGVLNYLLYLICIISSIGIILGYRYRLSIITFFLIFTYTELIDKTTYLNHYYFTSCISFLLCFLPAASYFSIDSQRNKEITKIPAWNIDALKFFLCIVYFYAGIAKINSDWLLDAQPLSIWLTSKYDIPFIGDLLQLKFVHYAASWSGMLYDVFIPFFLLSKKTRKIAFLFVILFHLMTKIFFPAIGMFPYIMIFCALIFFDESIHQKWILNFKKLMRNLKIRFNINHNIKTNPINLRHTPHKFILPLFICFFVFQLILPFRYFAYPGELFWNEQGYRFSWRVMLMEKKGYTTFKIKDSVSKKSFYVDNSDFLTPFQEKQMSFQPDFILEYAHYLAEHFEKQGHTNVQVFADSFVALNGRPSQRFIDPDIDLYKEVESFKHKKWVIPFTDEIYGL
ncbi:HTTM domain-containing protein [Flavobacteriaceae bacterium]|nr:HTTM domain-containing protein [Flavobacteriaceae bacterium]